MGNSAPSGDSHDPPNNPLDEFDGIETLGYRVLGVQPSSPASAAGLVSFFDFIVGANGEPLLASGEGLEEGEEYDDVDFPALLQQHKGKPVELCELPFYCILLLLRLRFVNGFWIVLYVVLDGLIQKRKDLLEWYTFCDDLEPQLTIFRSACRAVLSFCYFLYVAVCFLYGIPYIRVHLHRNKNNTGRVVVWNIKSQQQRFVDLTPDDTWGGAGLLGVTIRLDNYGGADERLIRVLEVENGSPASIAGLVSLHDFLLGTNVVAFESTETLAAVLHQHVNQIVELYVYNAESDIVRVVPLMPSLSWGGQGLLGAEVGTGYLHRLPGTTRSTPGSSVERKVRWINREGGGGNQTSDNDQGDNSTAPTTTGSSSTGIVPDENTPLELEPHLEMEVEHENDRRRPEDITKQPHQLGEEVKSPTNASSSSSPTSLGGNSSWTQNVDNGTPNSQQPSQMSPTFAAATTTTSTTTRQFPDLPPLPPPPQGVTSPVGARNKFSHTAKPVEDAEALFSGPPPSAFLPPPPKMMT
jgi:hypothetical protein